MAQIVTITNPLTGQPAQVDQLEHTAQEIDDAIARALPGGAIDITLQNKPGRIGNLTWHTLPLNDGVSHGEYFDIRYAKDDAGMVYLSILYQYSNNNASTMTGYLNLATLPEGFRPQMYVVACANEPWAFTHAPLVSINQNGTVQVIAKLEQYGCQAFAMFPATV